MSDLELFLFIFFLAELIFKITLEPLIENLKAYVYRKIFFYFRRFIFHAVFFLVRLQKTPVTKTQFKANNFRGIFFV